MQTRIFIGILIAFVGCPVNGKKAQIPAGSRIIGGAPADISDYPYQILLLIDGEGVCGGSIISTNFVLTAAHCIYGQTENQLQVRAGSTYRSTGGQVVGVKKINYLQDSFNIDTYDYDIAVLELSKALVFGNGVSAVSLPAATDEVSNGETSIVTGWGQTDPDDDTSLSDQLQVVILPTISTSTCGNYYGSYVTQRMFCAGYQQGGKDACQGDSGGPLVINGVQYGITSWGDICAQASSPGVFTKLSAFRSYIDGIIS
ncbi:trypsin-1-like [Cylas formicarius]|uniref:trypsin-1-like n=1 Tax=Cylas formicarius TaxID=197179 RepID=UPI00295890D3|nr:trypsin-1-like [Cylas formicarius]